MRGSCLVGSIRQELHIAVEAILLLVPYIPQRNWRATKQCI